MGGSVKDQLYEHFAVAFKLPPAAVDWLLSVWDAIQVLDDVADKDDIARDDLDSAIFSVLVGMPSNQFFIANSVQLLPALALMVLKWKASDDAEREGNADEKSFVWRAAYYDVVLLVVLLCHGPQVAMTAAKHVMALYGETYEEYCKEFTNA
jgi:heme exporter protein D